MNKNIYRNVLCNIYFYIYKGGIQSKTDLGLDLRE